MRIVATISTYGADRNVPFLYVLVELRFQSTAQIVADINLEIFNGWIFTWQYSAERSGDLFHNFAARDSRKSLSTKRNTYCYWSAPVFSWCRNSSRYNTNALFKQYSLQNLEEPILLNRVLVFWCCVILVRGFRQARTTRTGCVKNSCNIPLVPQEVEPWNMAGTISCADPTARFPCNMN